MSVSLQLLNFSVFNATPVVQPCQVDLDLAWLDVNRNFVCVFWCIVVIRNLCVECYRWYNRARPGTTTVDIRGASIHQGDAKT